MRKTTWKKALIGCTTLVACIAANTVVEAGPSVRRASRAGRMEASREAAAALTAVGAASGWGRIKVEDSFRGGVAEREVEIDLYDLEPLAEFSVEADGVHLGTMTTDASGWATLKLESNDDGHPPVPAGLPPVFELSVASVRDTSSAFVLEGSFVRFGDGENGSTVHEEKISLLDQAGMGASGVAKVERETNGSQEFDTRATGLPPGATFTITVDGLTAGMATADPIGQARLHLEAPDDSNPLPEALGAVEEFGVILWLDGAGGVVLAGGFTGVSNGDDGPGDDNGGNGGDDGPGDDNGGNGGDDGPGDDNGGDDDDDDDGDEDDDDDDDNNDDDGGGNSGPGRGSGDD